MLGLRFLVVGLASGIVLCVVVLDTVAGLVGDVHDQVATLFGYADIVLGALNGYVFAVLGGPDRVHESVKVDVAVHAVFVNFDFTVVQAIFVDGGKHLFGEIERNVDADGLVVVVG